MAQPANTFATNDQVGVREDLSGVINNIAPVETPFISGVRHVDATNTTHEWQTDDLTAAANNAAIEGDDAAAGASSATTRLTNLTQISEKVARVSGTARAVDTAGRSDELDYQVMKRGREVRRDKEFAALANKAKVAGNDTLAREAAGVPAYIATNISTGAGGSASAGTGADTVTEGSSQAFIEGDLQTVIESCWTNGGNPNVIMANAFNRSAVSSFSTNRSNIQRAEDKTLHATFEVYESDYGELKLIPNRFCDASIAYVLDMDHWAIAHVPGRSMVTYELAKTGDSDAKQVLSEWTVEACQEAASGLITGLSTS
jgi:hypothetical protein